MLYGAPHVHTTPTPSMLPHATARPGAQGSAVAIARAPAVAESPLAASSPRERQKSHAVMPMVIARAAPNSLVSQGVGPVSTVTRSKKPCTKRLCEACRRAAGHALPDRRRSHASTTPTGRSDA